MLVWHAETTPRGASRCVQLFILCLILLWYYSSRFSYPITSLYEVKIKRLYSLCDRLSVTFVLAYFLISWTSFVENLQISLLFFSFFVLPSYFLHNFLIQTQITAFDMSILISFSYSTQWYNSFLHFSYSLKKQKLAFDIIFQ